MKSYKIPLVDNDRSVLSDVKRWLAAEDFQVTRAEREERAVKLLRKEAFDLVIADLIEAEGDQFALVKKAREIRRLWEANPEHGYQQALARQFCISDKTINHVILRRSWKHV